MHVHFRAKATKQNGVDVLAAIYERDNFGKSYWIQHENGKIGTELLNKKLTVKHRDSFQI